MEKNKIDHRFPRTVWIIATALALSAAASAWAAPRGELWTRWSANDPASAAQVDHSLWRRFLQTYLVTDDPSGVNLVRYSQVSEADRKKLHAYLDQLQQVKVTGLNRREQKAYWINLYNALTVKVVLEHYPVKSIRDINLSSGLRGLVSGGPWKAKLVKVEGEPVSLDDIEHRILRPIWQDARVHYAVNCASIGCPNLQPEPFSADNLDASLDQAAREYVNHPRGVSVASKDKAMLSSIYDWFREDFGDTEKELLLHLQKYAKLPLAEVLANFRGRIDYRYDWSLNDARP